MRLLRDRGAGTGRSTTCELGVDEYELRADRFHNGQLSNRQRRFHGEDGIKALVHELVSMSVRSRGSAPSGRWIHSVRLHRYAAIDFPDLTDAWDEAKQHHGTRSSPRCIVGRRRVARWRSVHVEVAFLRQRAAQRDQRPGVSRHRAPEGMTPDGLGRVPLPRRTAPKTSRCSTSSSSTPAAHGLPSNPAAVVATVELTRGRRARTARKPEVNATVYGLTVESREQLERSSRKRSAANTRWRSSAFDC